MLRFRWLMLMAGIVLFLVALHNGDINKALSAFIIGVAGGFFIDCVGCGILHFWEYPRQPFPGVKHIFIVLPSWGIFSITINLLWDGVRNPWLIFVLLFFVQMTIYEAVNKKTESWIYFTPAWLVIVGWFPLVISLRLLFIFFQ